MNPFRRSYGRSREKLDEDLDELQEKVQALYKLLGAAYDESTWKACFKAGKDCQRCNKCCNTTCDPIAKEAT